MVTAAQALDAYDRLTGQRTRFVRVDELCARADFLPSKEQLEKEARLPLKDKQGLERAHGEFLSRILADPAAGTHLCHAMLLPHPKTNQHRAEFERTGTIQFPGARLE